MDQIPFLGWVAIIIIVAIFVVINLGLVSILRDREQFEALARRIKARPPARPVQTINRVIEVLRDPYGEQRRQVDELSRLVSSLQEPTQTGAAPANSERADADGSKPNAE